MNSQEKTLNEMSPYVQSPSYVNNVSVPDSGLSSDFVDNDTSNVRYYLYSLGFFVVILIIGMIVIISMSVSKSWFTGEHVRSDRIVDSSLKSRIEELTRMQSANMAGM